MKGLLNKRLMQGPLYKHPTTTCMTFIFVIGYLLALAFSGANVACMVAAKCVIAVRELG